MCFIQTAMIIETSEKPIKICTWLFLTVNLVYLHFDPSFTIF